MKISVGCDHGGYSLKEAIKKHLADAGHEVRDVGCHGVESVDYPDFGERASSAVARGECEMGMLICKSGIGMSIVANKVPGVRAALCLDSEMAELSRMHNDANVLVLSANRTGEKEAIRILDTWLNTPFEGGRHQGRVDKIKELERRQASGSK